MSNVNSLKLIPILIRYWIKGRFTKTALVGVLIGEIFSIFFILFASDTFLSFSGRFGLGTELTVITWSLILSFFLIGLIQSGFNGSGLPVSGGDVDYVFTSPVKSRDIFIAKVLMNSITTVLFGFPPIFVLYIRISIFYESSVLAAAIAGFVTLIYFLMGLFLSADVTLSLGRLGRRVSVLKIFFIAFVLFISLAPFLSILDEVPRAVFGLIRFLPNGLTARTSIGLISSSSNQATLFLDSLLLLVWLGGLSLLGVRLSRTHFYELVHIRQPRMSKQPVQTSSNSELNPRGSIWSVVGRKERIIIKRTKELRALLINTLFLSGFMIIYSLSGSFQTSPVSFLFILYIIGSFGSGNGLRWIEKERLWILKTSAISMKRYVKEIFRARISPLLLSLAPIIGFIGIFFMTSRPVEISSQLSLILVLPAALQIPALMMGGSMYFAARYGQSTSDDILESQTQELVDVKRFIYQALINLVLVSPLMLLVIGSERLTLIFGTSIATIPMVLVLTLSLVYTWVILNIILNKAGEMITMREDL